MSTLAAIIALIFGAVVFGVSVYSQKKDPNSKKVSYFIAGIFGIAAAALTITIALVAGQ